MGLRNIDMRAGLIFDEVEEIIKERTQKYDDPRDIGLQLRQVLSNVTLLEKDMRPKDMVRKMLLEQMMNKLARYLVNWPNGERDSLNDLIGYTAMLQAHDEHLRDKGDGSHTTEENML